MFLLSAVKIVGNTAIYDFVPVLKMVLISVASHPTAVGAIFMALYRGGVRVFAYHICHLALRISPSPLVFRQL